GNKADREAGGERAADAQQADRADHGRDRKTEDEAPDEEGWIHECWDSLAATKEKALGTDPKRSFPGLWCDGWFESALKSCTSAPGGAAAAQARTRGALAT